MRKNIFHLEGKVWVYPSQSAQWYFVSLAGEIALRMKEQYGALRRGWGSLPVRVTIGKTTWDTSIFPDKRIQGYLLPIKASVRAAQAIQVGDTLSFKLHVRV